MKVLFSLPVLAALFVSLSGCVSVDWTHRAVQKARAKAVEELNLLSDADRFEIKFGQPEIYRQKLLNRSDRADISKNDICHTWIVWRLPDSAGKCVVVSGVSEGRMDDWRPERVLIRELSDLEFPQDESEEEEGEEE